MKIKSHMLNYMFHLNRSYSVMDALSVRVLIEFFRMIDVHDKMGLDDIQFYQVMSHLTDLDRAQIYAVFDMLDVDGSGEIETDEFYLIIAILVAVKDGQEKEFIYRHSRTVFDLMDEDGSNSISAEEFENFGFLFNFQIKAIRKIFHEFDISGDAELDYKEFRLFTMACIDMQNDMDEQNKRNAQKNRPRHATCRKYNTAIWPLPEDEDDVEDVLENQDVGLVARANKMAASRSSTRSLRLWSGLPMNKGMAGISEEEDQADQTKRCGIQ